MFGECIDDKICRLFKGVLRNMLIQVKTGDSTDANWYPSDENGSFDGYLFLCRKVL